MGAYVLELEAAVEVGPSSAYLPAPAREVVFDAKATSGLHPAVPIITAGTYAAMIGVFWAGFGGSLGIAFPLLIVTLLLAAFFGGPLIMDSVRVNFLERHGTIVENPGSFRRFLAGHFGTASGPVSGLEALVLVVTVPVCLLLAAASFAIIYHLV